MKKKFKLLPAVVVVLLLLPSLGLQKTWCMATPASRMASPTSLAWRLPTTVSGQSRANPSGPARRSGTLAIRHRTGCNIISSPGQTPPARPAALGRLLGSDIIYKD